MNIFSKLLLSIVILFLLFISCSEKKSNDEIKQENKNQESKQENKNDKVVNLPEYSIINQNYENPHHKTFDIYLKDLSNENASVILDKIIDENKEDLTSIGIGFWDKQLSKEAIENFYKSGNKNLIPTGTRTIQGYYSFKPKQKRLDPIEVL